MKARVTIPTPLPMRMLSFALLFVLACCLPTTSLAARAGFHVQYPWLSRAKPQTTRSALKPFDAFCGDIIHGPQGFAGYYPTFVSFSGNAGDLVSIYYTRHRVPRSVADFAFVIAQDVAIAESGQLCFDIQMPTPVSDPEFGVLLFEARDPSGGDPEYFCSDVGLIDIKVLGEQHPAMCAANNETLIPMPDEFL